ncbi:MAG: toll/interleukin-1 receptor domain-containing protein [Prevotellaceae bacterium]|nr:toll/interleukin-1 receptor domain-containing protein [Candidatus Colivivens equi]
MEKQLKYDVFLCHSSFDRGKVDLIRRHLREAGLRCFVSYCDIIPNRVWAEAIVEAIDNSRMMVAIVSQSFNESPQVDREIEMASQNNIPILPIKLEKCEYQCAKKYYLGNLHYIDASNSLKESLPQLSDSIKIQLNLNSETVVSGNNGGTSEINNREKKVKTHLFWLPLFLLLVSIGFLVFFYPEYVHEHQENVREREMEKNMLSIEEQYQNCCGVDDVLTKKLLGKVRAEIEGYVCNCDTLEDYELMRLKSIERNLDSLVRPSLDLVGEGEIRDLNVPNYDLAKKDASKQKL